MKVVKSLILLSLTLLAADFGTPSQALARSSIPAACTKIKHDMFLACSQRRSTCEVRTNALNRCIKKSAYRPVSKIAQVKPSLCAMIYQPVCAVTSKGNLQVFSNSCEAAKVNASEVPLNQCGSK